MASPLFDRDLRRMRRDRAARSGPELFLFDRAFEDILDRLGDVKRRFASALLVGCPDPRWPRRLTGIVGSVAVTDPGQEFAAAAGGIQAEEDRLPFEAASFDLCIAVGTLDSAADIQAALGAIRSCLGADSLLIGAIAGNGSLAALRTAMLAADRAGGRGAAPHVHPRIDAPTLATLLASRGFTMPVVDVDRAEVSYRSLGRLVGDLRAMAATSILVDRPRLPVGKAGLDAAEKAFRELGDGERTSERFDILHFAAWTPGHP
jgi:NADH dehydrogenase [ubiquinone] 1 alpha subcomplex assembly factor 5